MPQLHAEGIAAASARPRERRRRRRPPTVRGLSVLPVTVLGLAALAVAASLVWTASLLRHTTIDVVQDTRDMVDTDAIELGIHTYRRLANLHVRTADLEVADARDEVRVQLHRRLEGIRHRATDPQQRALVVVAGREIQSWFDTRERLERGAPRVGEVVRAARPSLERALSSLDALRRMHAAQVQSEHARRTSTARTAEVIATCAVFLWLLALVALVWGIHHFVTRPVLDLHAAIRRFRAGEMETRVPERGASELREVGHAFNAMAETLGRQRKCQLEFLAGVVHDLRNPLSGLGIGMQTLREQDDPALRARTLELVERQVGRLSRMVDDLLEAARIEGGQLELSRETFDLRTTCEATVALYAPTSDAHEIVIDVPEEPVLIDADPTRVEQVLNNLLSNAIKFSPDGGRIDVRVRNEGTSARLEVEDHGIGIPRESIPELFAPFRRRRPDVAPGAGLGLSVVRKIVQAHGGSMEVDSRVGVGSIFRARLPLAGRPADVRE